MTAATATRKTSKTPRYAPLTSRPGRLAMVAPERIQVDHRYQRPEVLSLIRNIANNFDYAAVKPISLALRPDGSLYAMDGQQEVAAARLRGDVPKLPAYITKIATVAEEAEIFRKINGPDGRKRLKALENHRANVMAGYPANIAIQAACDRAGVELVMGASSGTKCNAIGSLMQWAGKRKGPEIRDELGALFNFLFTTWPGDPKVLSGRFVMGILRFLSQVGPEGRARVMAQPDRLGRNPVDHYTHKAAIRAQALDKTIVKTLPEILREAFNVKLKAGSRI